MGGSLMEGISVAAPAGGCVTTHFSGFFCGRPQGQGAQQGQTMLSSREGETIGTMPWVRASGPAALSASRQPHVPCQAPAPAPAAHACTPSPCGP